MGQPVVLPKFDLPTEKQHWAVRMAWIVGGLLLASIVILGGAIWYHRSELARLEIAKIEAAAKAKAEIDARVAAAAAAARAAKEAELEAKRAKEAVPTTGVAAAASEPGSAPAAGKTPRRHRARAATKTAKLDTKAGGAKSEAKKNDAIDELLKKMGK